jgi:hypothetical protein
MEEKQTELPPILQEHKDKFDHVAGELQKRMAEAKAAGRLLEISAEESDVLKYFRRFKAGLKKDGVFTFQTVPYTEQEKEAIAKGM